MNLKEQSQETVFPLDMVDIDMGYEDTQEPEIELVDVVYLLQGKFLPWTTILDSSCFNVGTTLEEYQNGAWYLLSEEQREFWENNPQAMDYEVINMALTPPKEKTLEEYRSEVIQLIGDRDKASDLFFIQLGDSKDAPKIQMWLSAQLRNQLLNSTLPAQKIAGEITTTLWTEDENPIPIVIPTQWGIENIPLVEHYAFKTLNAYKQNLSKAKLASSKEELDILKIYLENPYEDIKPVVLILSI